MTETSKVAGVTTHLLISNLSKSFVLLLFFIAVSKLLGSDYLGAYSLALAITTPFFAFGLLGTRVARVTGPVQISNASYEIGLIFSGLFATMSSLLFSLFFFPDALSIVLWVSIFKWSDLFTELYAGSLQLNNKTMRLATISLVGSLLIGSISIGTLLVSDSLNYSLAVFALLGWGFAVSFRFLSIKYISKNQTFTRIKQVFLLGIPLGISGAIAALGSTFPQYRMAGTLGDTAVGVLAIFLYIYALADIFGAAYGQAWIPKIKALQSYRKQVFFVISIGLYSTLAAIPITAIGIWIFSAAAPLIFGSFFSVTLSEAIPLFCTVVALPYVHIVATALFVRVHYKRSLTTMLISTLVTVVAAILLIPSQGIAGGIYAVAAGLLTRGIISTIFLVLTKDKQIA